MSSVRLQINQRVRQVLRSLGGPETPETKAEAGILAGKMTQILRRADAGPRKQKGKVVNSVVDGRRRVGLTRYDGPLSELFAGVDRAIQQSRQQVTDQFVDRSVKRMKGA